MMSVTNGLFQSILDVVTVFANQNSIPLFLIDSEVLSNISKNSQTRDGHPFCNVLCSNRKITHLATLGQFATQLLINRWVASIKAKGFTVLEFSELDPTVIHYNLKVSIPTHLIVLDENIDIRKPSHVIHVVVLYERIQSKNWWHGVLKLDDYQKRLLHIQGLRKPNFKVSHSSGIYDK